MEEEIVEIDPEPEGPATAGDTSGSNQLSLTAEVHARIILVISMKECT